MQRVWLSRLRWRVRGAWAWPSFAVLTVVDAVLVHELPLAGDGTAWIPALLLVSFFNLMALAVVGPALGLLWRRRRADLPAIVATDRGATAALVATTAILAAVGLAHRPAREAQRDDFAAQAVAVRRYVARRAAPEYRRHIDAATSLRLGDVYRTCVPGDDPQRALCLFVDLGESPPGIRRDSNPVPNDVFEQTLRP